MIGDSRSLAALRHIARAPEVIRCAREVAEWRKVTAAYLGIGKFPFPSEIHLRDGNQFRLAELYDIETLWQIYFHRVYEVRPTDRVVIDAGANIGLFSCWAARVARHATIYALEPAPATFERLKRHVSVNGLTNRVKCFQAAVAGQPGRLMMSTSRSASQMFRLLAPGEKVPESAVDVEVMTLRDFFDKVLADSKAGRIDLLKMDIEGSEYETLTSDRLEIVDRIQVEYHKTEASSVYSRAKLMQHLEGRGFRLTRHRGDDDYGMLWYGR